MELAIFPQRLRNHVDLEEKDDDGWKNVAGGEGGGKKYRFPFFSSLFLFFWIWMQSQDRKERKGEKCVIDVRNRGFLLFSFLFFFSFFPLLDFTQSQEVEKRGRERERNNVINVQSKFFIARFLPLRAPVRNRVSISRGSRDYFMNMHRLLLIHIHARVIHNGPLPLDVQRLRR